MSIPATAQGGKEKQVKNWKLWLFPILVFIIMLAGILYMFDEILKMVLGG